MFECSGCGEVTAGRRGRVYCSNRCQRRAQQRSLVALWLSTGLAQPSSKRGHYVRDHVAAEQQHRCAICNSPEQWQGLPMVFVLDHVDGDSSNNRRDNLRLICPNCDSQLETYKNRNNGRGRHLRRQRYADGKSY